MKTILKSQDAMKSVIKHLHASVCVFRLMEMLEVVNTDSKEDCKGLAGSIRRISLPLH